MSQDFGNILSAYSGMTRSKTGRVEEAQPKIEHPTFNETKDEIVDIMNAIRSVNGQPAITEESVNENNAERSKKLEEKSKRMIDIYASSIK
jgi:aminoglycoside phosphotransferase (APT) family kinase protein